MLGHCGSRQTSCCCARFTHLQVLCFILSSAFSGLLLLRCAATSTIRSFPAQLFSLFCSWTRLPRAARANMCTALLRRASFTAANITPHVAPPRKIQRVLVLRQCFRGVWLGLLCAGHRQSVSRPRRGADTAAAVPAPRSKLLLASAVAYRIRSRSVLHVCLHAHGCRSPRVPRRSLLQARRQNDPQDFVIFLCPHCGALFCVFGGQRRSWRVQCSNSRQILSGC